ncbi:MAG: adenylate kinase [Lentisphaeria bacterium]|jgi:adenylate kinase|nr:adenylate kinase [Lentisphaeria bacterium]MDP7739921.1 adenylate kinase [Lentisphaeria bacterium]
MANYAFLGPPGVGKGTLAAEFCNARGMQHVSTGDLLRAEIQAGSELGCRVQEFVSSGGLVPDDIILDLMENFLTGDSDTGYILDGFPRTIEQAERVEAMAETIGFRLVAAILLEASDQIVVDRLTGRRICRGCKATYHLSFGPPQQAGLCDKCSGELYQRGDDQEETVRRRLEVYRNQTAPLIDFYDNLNRIIRIDASSDKATNFAALSEKVP